MTNKSATRLGNILLKKGLLTAEQLRIAVSTQVQRRQQLDPLDTNSYAATSLGEILIELGFIDRLELKRGLNWQMLTRKITLAMSLCAPLLSISYEATAATSSSLTASSQPATVGSSLPVVIEAENYSTMSGVFNEPTTDTGGGQATGNINTNDWMRYANSPVNIPVTGSYTITFRVASLNGGGSLSLFELSNNLIYDTFPVPKTGSWIVWTTVQRTITLTAGIHTFGINAAVGGFNVNWFKIESVNAAASSVAASSKPASSTPTSSIAASSTPASSTPASSKPASSIPASSIAASSIPASSAAASSTPPSSVAASSTPASSTPASSTAASSLASSVAAGNPLPVTIEAENYSTMSGVFNEPTTDTGGGQATGNINTNDWMRYANSPVNIPVTGSYTITFRVASLNGGGSLSLFELSNNLIYDTFPVPSTGSWVVWTSVQRTITLTAGVHTFGINAAVGGFNVNWFKIEAANGVASSSASSVAASSVAASSTPISSIAASSNPASSSSSAASSLVATHIVGPVDMNWTVPNLRENGLPLDITELGGYELRYKLLADADFTYISINDPWTNFYSFSWLEGDYIFQIAAFDKDGLYSNFVNVVQH